MLTVDIWPDAFDKYLAPIPEDERHDLISAYYKQLTNSDETISLRAAKAWATWEESTSKLYQDPAMVALADNDVKWARCVGNEVLDADSTGPLRASSATTLSTPASSPRATSSPSSSSTRCELRSATQAHDSRHLPCIVVQGRYDCVCPVSIGDWHCHVEYCDW